jgi:hypothetical protein
MGEAIDDPCRCGQKQLDDAAAVFEDWAHTRSACGPIADDLLPKLRATITEDRDRAEAAERRLVIQAKIAVEAFDDNRILRDRLRLALALLGQVAALHQPRHIEGHNADGDERESDVCESCWAEDWPCPTHVVLSNVPEA